MAPQTVEHKTCPECGAELAATASACWLCRRNLASGPMIIMAEVASGPPKFAASEVVFAVATLLIVLLMVLMGVGAFLAAPGLGLLYCLFAVPPLLITLVRTQRQQARFGTASWADRLLTLVLSSAVAVGTAMMLVVAAFIAFFIWCWFVILPH